jgi:hypothetical protein
MEGKYRFRKGSLACPECGKESTIIKGKKEYGGGWLCYKNKGGCGAKFKDEDPFITQQDTEKVEHDNPADYYNTVLKMAKKRAHVDAILTATAASDIFTQDIEDMPEVINGEIIKPEANKESEIKKEQVPKDKPKLGQVLKETVECPNTNQQVAKIYCETTCKDRQGCPLY